MAQRFRFQGVTAQGFVIDEEITAFYVDNPKGSFGLMAGHAPIVSGSCRLCRNGAREWVG